MIPTNVLIASGLMVVLVVMSILQWSGRWRSWYRPKDPVFALIFATIGPSPLLVPVLLGGIVALIALILVAATFHLSALIWLGLVAELVSLALAGWIAFGQPRWALPIWMRDANDSTRLRRDRRRPRP